MSSRDFASGQSSNTYRPATSTGPRDRPFQWDQGRGSLSRSSTGDYDRDRDRDRDRIYDRDRDRDRDRRTDPRDREPPRRDLDLTWPQAPRSQSPKMAPDKASAEIAKGFRATCDIMAKKVQLSYKRDIETKAFRRREHDYNNKISGAKQFPAVNELFAKSNKHHKEIVEPIDKELAGLTTHYQNVTDNFADCLVKAVKALPVNEIKTRQVIDAVKGELARETKSSQPVQDDRVQKLEELVKSLAEKQQAQDIELTNLKKLNDRLRTGESKAETLEKEKGQLQSENLSLKTQLDALVKRIESIEAWKVMFPTQVESQRLDLGRALEQAKAEWSANTTTQISLNAVQDDTTHEKIAALGHKDDALSAEIAALRRYVDGHEDLLANVDIENLDDTIAKVSEYPRYTVLNDRVTSQQAGVDSLKESLHNTKQELEKGLAERFKGFSDKIIHFCGPKFVSLESRVKELETADSSTAATPITMAPVSQASISKPESTSASGPNLTSNLESVLSRLDAAESRLTTEESRLTATESNVVTLQTKTDALQTDVVAIRGLMEQRHGALETMVESLDDQWKNLNTTQMAQYMLEHLSRLQPSQLTPELQQFHMRLADLEKLVRDTKQQNEATRDRVRAYCDGAVDPGAKRTYSGDEKFPAMKRARVESMNSVNGVNGVNDVANGHADP